LFFSEKKKNLESITQAVYSFKTDVWSYGVLVVEIMTQGDPYPQIQSLQVAAQVSKGNLRPTLPDSAPSEYCELVSNCCEFNPQNRPSFEQICSRLN